MCFLLAHCVAPSKIPELRPPIRIRVPPDVLNCVVTIDMQWLARFVSPSKDFEFRMSTGLGMSRLRTLVGWHWEN